MNLQKRSFKLATWNMCGQGTRTAPNSKEKLRFAEQLMFLEDLDVLVLTETHTTSLPVSWQVRVLEQSGLASQAGVAIVVRADAGWEVLHRQVLILGYAVIIHITNRINWESFWILGVYGDISQGSVLLGRFMERLRLRLSAFVKRQAKTHWGGCFAIRDWNFVEHAGDRFPSGNNQGIPKKVLTTFEEVKRLCAMRDMSGRGPSPKTWTYSKMTHNGMAYSRLDRIYRPSSCWESGTVMPIASGWSDHRILVALVHVTKPKIDRAVPAPRLPAVEVLGKTKKFWPGVLLDWGALTDSGPVTLEKWRVFKDNVLRAGWEEMMAMKSFGKKNWLTALRQEQVAPGDIMSAITKANAFIWARREPPARMLPHWPAAIPAYDDAPRAHKGFYPGPKSPWQVPVRPRKFPLDSTERAAPSTVRMDERKVSDLLRARAERYEKAAKAKVERMTRTHSSEWYKQSSNKELDERGSRASVSVEGLRCPGEDIALTSLSEMALVAKDYFHHLHTPEPCLPERRAAQDALLEEVRKQGLLRPEPAHENIVNGSFMMEEMKAL